MQMSIRVGMEKDWGKSVSKNCLKNEEVLRLDGRSRG